MGLNRNLEPYVYVYMWECSCSSLASGPLRDYCDWIGMVRKLAQIARLAQEAAKGWWEIKTSLNANCHREEDTGRESMKEKDWEGAEFPVLILLAQCGPTHIFCFWLRMLFQDVCKCNILPAFYSSLLIYHFPFIHGKCLSFMDDALCCFDQLPRSEPLMHFSH